MKELREFFEEAGFYGVDDFPVRCAVVVVTNRYLTVEDGALNVISEWTNPGLHTRNGVYVIEDIFPDDKDPINPDHYKLGGIETIDYMQAKSTPEEFKGHLRLTAIKYLSRVGHKDDFAQELHKAKWYIEKLIEVVEDGR